MAQGGTRSVLLMLIAATVLLGCASTGEQDQMPARAERNAERVGAPKTPAEKRCVAEALNIVVPQYAPAIRSRNLQGWVLLRFDLDGSGRASNITVVDETPPGVFGAATIKALQRSRFVVGVQREGCESVATFSMGR